MKKGRQNIKAKYHMHDQGFALVATLLLLVLLALLAVGMLSLSVVTLRTTTQSTAHAEARDNARIALTIAIGELQKSMGPDRRISATSEILATSSNPPAKPNITGVWESWWDFDPGASPSPSYSDEKRSRFRRWLVSSADMTDTESRDFVNIAWTGKTIELVGSGSLGANATDAEKVTAGLIPISKEGGVKGSYAWHVSDESVKARVNLYRDPARNTTLAEKRSLLAGHRPDPSVIRGTDGSLLTSLPTDHNEAEFASAQSSGAKITNLVQAELLDGAKGTLKPLRNHITTYSVGVLTDVRSGGLKEDLSSMFEMGSATANTLPADFTGQKLYESTLGVTGVSDPNWSALAGYYNSFRRLSSPETNPTLELKQGPATFASVPDGYNPAPVIAKVDAILSVVARPLYSTSIANSQAAEVHDFMVNIIFTPVVTLHNPYNVNISFHKMQVQFDNIPIAFNFMLQPAEGGGFRSMSVSPGAFEALNTMAKNSNVGGRPLRSDRKYAMTIADWSDSQPLSDSTAVTGPIILKPGQTLVCGSILPPDSSYDGDSRGSGKAVGVDRGGDLIGNIKAVPSFTPGLGFETDAPTISAYRLRTRAPGELLPTSALYPGAWGGQPYFFLRDEAATPKVSESNVTDQFYLEYKVQRPFWYPDDVKKTTVEADPNFAVKAQLQATESSQLEDFANLVFDYKDDATIKDLFDDRVYRFPSTGYMTGTQIAAPAGVKYSEQASYVHPIAIFSAYSRTTNGGVYETGSRTKSEGYSSELNLLKDGRVAGKPFLFHNPSRSNFTVDLATAKLGAQSYELNFQPFLSKGEFQDYMNVDASNRVPSLTGNQSTTGIKSGSYLALPSGPLQTIADFRRSNALVTSFPPYFAQPVGNSLLHPYMSSDKVIETNANVATTELLDHSVLANHALYDRFYFSTFATRGTTTPDVVFEEFMNGTEPLASQAFLPYLPYGKTPDTAKASLFDSGLPLDRAYKIAARYQMIRGSFNVNSTSVQAWKAVLASMNKADINTLWARNSQLESTTANGIPIPAMSLLNGGANGSSVVDGSKIDDVKTNDWNGYRELTEEELQTLAEKIVDEVRERGPFLSMSEFVNRQVGPLGPLTLSGALESAIAKAEINEEQAAEFPNTFLGQVPITEADVSDPKIYSYKTPEATTGNPAAGAPGWVSQGDLLRILGPSATVRGDTFVIRAYGEAQDASGNITARAYAEAVVQRVPDYVDLTDSPSINVYSALGVSEANKNFGRRIRLMSFRWLSDTEI
jgi:hypothetical protein